MIRRLLGPQLTAKPTLTASRNLAQNTQTEKCALIFRSEVLICLNSLRNTHCSRRLPLLPLIGDNSNIIPISYRLYSLKSHVVRFRLRLHPFRMTDFGRFLSNSKHVLNAQVSIRAPCCQKWFDVGLKSKRCQ